MDIEGKCGYVAAKCIGGCSAGGGTLVPGVNVAEDGGEATEGPGALGWSLGDCEGGVPSPGGGGMPFGLRFPASLRPLRVYGRFAGPIS